MCASRSALRTASPDEPAPRTAMSCARRSIARVSIPRGMVRRTLRYGQVEERARTPLSRRAWTHAALEAIAEGGLAAVAVAPLAIRLGATKGSFYWHFASRESLV